MEGSKHPVAGVDYPRTFQEFEAWFGDETACRDYLRRLRHQVSVISAGSDPAHVVMPRVHKVVSLLRRWLMRTHQGGIQRQHLDYYLDEFTFRFNRRRSKARGLLFHRLAQQAVAVGPAPYHQIIATNDPAPALEAT